MKRYIALILSVLMVLMSVACGAHPSIEGEKGTESAPTAEEIAEQERLAAEDAKTAALQQLVDGMSLEEKVGQLFFVRCPEENAEEDLAAYHFGGILLFGRDFKDANENYLEKDTLTDKLAGYQSVSQQAGGIPLFIGSDEEGGTVTRASRNPNLFAEKLPSPQELYQSGGMDGLLSATRSFNETLLSYGINVNFAPVADVSVNAEDFIYARTFGQNASATADYIAKVVGVMNDIGMGSMLKHFPGYGNNADTHTGIAVDERAMTQFEAEDFLPFSAGIEAGAPFVLVSHNIINCMDSSLPASLSPAVHAVLREQLGFEGVIITDELSMDAVNAYAEDGSVAVLALLAGNDMLCTTDYSAQIPAVIAAVQSGELDEALIDTACLRVLRAKCDLGLLTLS